MARADPLPNSITRFACLCGMGCIIVNRSSSFSSNSTPKIYLLFFASFFFLLFVKMFSYVSNIPWSIEHYSQYLPINRNTVADKYPFNVIASNWNTKMHAPKHTENAPPKI